MALRRLGIALMDVITGDGCAGCALPGPPLCDACRAALPVVGDTTCRRCGHPWAQACDGCAQCIAGVARARQALAYDHPVPALVSALKDRRRIALAGPLAAVITAALPPPPPGSVLVPVPLAPRRQAERGFNQAHALARALGDAWGVPVGCCLARRDGGPTQRGSAAGERRAQVQGVFDAAGPVPLHAVLVDDVVTTGATLAAAARALRIAGCARVGAVALARVAVGGGSTRVGRRHIS